MKQIAIKLESPEIERFFELKKIIEAKTNTEALRRIINELHKKIFNDLRHVSYQEKCAKH